MDLFNAVAVTVWLALGAALGYALFAAWRRVVDDNSPLPFFHVLERLGMNLEDLESAPRAEKFARAVRACAGCRAKQECRDWLQTAPAGRAAPFCPNAGVLQAMRPAEYRGTP